MDCVSQGFFALSLAIHECGVVRNPLGVVEVRRWPGSALLMGTKPSDPLAVGVAGEQSSEPGCPDERCWRDLGIEMPPLGMGWWQKGVFRNVKVPPLL